MTDCITVRDQLDALLDGELGAAHAAAALDHLKACSICREELKAREELDQQLRAAVPIGEIQNRIEQIYAASAPTRDSLTLGGDLGGGPEAEFRSTGRSRSPRLLPWILLTAAALLAMTWIAWPATPTPNAPTAKERIEGPQPTRNQPFVARLVRSTGSVEWLAPGENADDESAWASLDSVTTATFERGCRLRTAPSVLCEVETTDKSKIRLNEAGEILLRDAQSVQLVRGQLWCLASPESELKVEIEMADVVEPLLATLRCPSQSELQCVSSGNAASCDSVSPKNSEATLFLGSETCVVKAGETVQFDSSQQFHRIPIASPAAKAWQLPLLAVSQLRDDASTDSVPSPSELTTVVGALLAPIGRTKAGFMNEQQIRSLGPAGALPLLAYALDSSSKEAPRLRLRAVAIAAETADQTALPMLRQLSADADPEIGRLAQSGIDRLGD